jgi:hypothetical protein
VTEDRLPIEFELLKDVAALDLEVIDTRIETLGDNTHVEIRMKDDPDVLESCAWGFIYAIGVLCCRRAPARQFRDRLPRQGRVDRGRLAASLDLRARPAPLLR